MTSLSILVIGFLLGLRHATDADHLAAVATLATRQSSLAQTMKQGVAWGIGHTLTLMLFGGVVLALGTAIPERMAQALELGVGLMLVVLGADVLRRLLRRRIHFHLHSHDNGIAHVHAHSHSGEGAHKVSPHRHAHREKPPLRALAIGIMHGMAGSAALVLLSLGAVQSPALGLLYIALFGIGSIAGMALLSVAIAIPLRLSAGHLAWLHNSMTALIGGATCALGAFMVYHIGFVEGLLRG
ncbi:MAG: urease accessory protein [Pseudomonadota bacterium]|nr:urease accessory protein [Pseudomonadota bacterium]